MTSPKDESPSSKEDENDTPSSDSSGGNAPGDTTPTSNTPSSNTPSSNAPGSIGDSEATAAGSDTPDEAATRATPAPPEGKSWARRMAGSVGVALLTWLIPIRKAVDADDGHLKLIYTSFPKSVYFYLIWLPGFISLGLHSFEIVSDTGLVWTLIVSCIVFYLTIAEDFQLTEFFLWLTVSILGVTLYRFGIIDFAWLKSGIQKLSELQLHFDRETISVITWGTFLFWSFIYVYSVTWRKRELSSNRRAKLRPPRGKKIIPVVGRIVDNELTDVLELVFGFGAYDVVITETSGRELDRDRNCVGLFLYINFFSDLVGRIATRDTHPGAAMEAAVAASDAGQEPTSGEM